MDGVADVEQLVVGALGGHRGATEALASAWDDGAPVGPVLDRRFAAAVAAAVSLGWRDDEVRRIVAKLGGADAGRALSSPVVDAWRSRVGARRAVPACVRALQLLARLPAPPGGAYQAAPAAGAEAAVLERVRALLAKAESTTFPAEAEALTAKAQELMARHAIDAVVVAGGSASGAVGSRRFVVDDPYARAKVQLLTEVATASSCRAVWSQGLGIVTVFGHAGDLDAVDLLHTSLLVQASAAMQVAATGGPGSRHRSRGFRNAFLLGFATRIGERLREASARAVAEAARDHGSGLLPVLASRAEAVDTAVQDACPDLVSRRVSASDGRGWAAGSAAARRADLGGRGGIGGGAAAAIGGSPVGG
jgi:hypothetical protein